MHVNLWHGVELAHSSLAASLAGPLETPNGLWCCDPTHSGAIQRHWGLKAQAVAPTDTRAIRGLSELILRTGNMWGGQTNGY